MSGLLIFIVILTLASAEYPTVGIGKNTTFDEENNNFILNYKGEKGDALLVLIDYESDNCFLNFAVGEGLNFESKSVSNKALLFILDTSKESYRLQINPSCESVNGSFKIYAFKNKLDIKFNKKYGNINHQLSEFLFKKQDFSELTFSITDLDRDVVVKFDYNPEVKIYSSSIEVENPFEVCYQNNCKGNITSYIFKKGFSYEVKVKLTVIKETNVFKYLLPGFEFYDVKYNGIDSIDDY